MGFEEATTLVVIGTASTGSCQSNYHTISTTAVQRTIHSEIDQPETRIAYGNMAVMFVTNLAEISNLP